MFDFGMTTNLTFLRDELYEEIYKIAFEDSLKIIRTIESFEIVYPQRRRVFCWQYRNNYWGCLGRNKTISEPFVEFDYIY